MARDGTHLHLPAARCIEIYAALSSLIRQRLPEARISLCKETHVVRKAVGLREAAWNCL